MADVVRSINNGEGSSLNSTFSLLTVLGNGSKSVHTHHRYPLAAYQSGTSLVLWDYVKERKQFIPLLPNQWCKHLWFSHDGLTLLAVWSGQSGQPTLTVWRVADGEKIAEQQLADACGAGQIICNFDAESSVLVLVQVLNLMHYWKGNLLY
jgi:hypothetical protein